MKKIGLVFCLVIFLSVSFQINAQWFWQNPLPQGNFLYSVEVNGTGFGIAVGDFGTILKTINGGLTWEIKSSPLNSNLIKVDVVDNKTIYAIGTGLVIKSIDGGESWIVVNNPSSSQSDICFLDELNGYIVGGSGSIFKTSDGGLTWINQISGTTIFLNCINFLDENVGIIGGHPNTLLYTTNSGNTWSTILLAQPPYQYYIWDVYLANNKKIFVIAGTESSDYVFMSTDEGQNWVNNIGGSNYLTEISFADSMNGLISGYNHSSSNGRVFRTIDGGFNWQEEVVNVGYQTWLTSISFPNIQYAVSIGDHGRMISSSDGGDNWIQTSSGPLTTFDDMSFFNQNHGIAVGTFGSMATSDGGENWEVTSGGSGYRCTMPSPNICFSAGGYNLAKSTDGGFTWVQHPISTEHYFMTISFCDTINGVATAMLGPQGKVIRTFDGGNTWAQIGSIQGHYIYDVCFVNPLLIYACSGSSYVFKSTNGGYSWSQQNTGISGSILYAIDFVNPNVGFAAGQHGKIIKTTDGGNSWILLSTGVSGQFEQIDFKDENLGLAACDNVLFTSDGGNSWTINRIISDNIRAVSTISESVWYAAGDNGAILKNSTGITPVELVSFSAYETANQIFLQWQTATETNNKGFQIDRRKTQNERSEDWKNIGFVNGNGTTTEPQSYSFVDENLSSGKYQYRLKQIDFDGTFEYSRTIEVEIITPSEFSLKQNYPNPFNPSTVIQYAISSRQFVTLKVYDVLGKEIATLVNEEKGAGSYNIEFNASHLASGIYYYQLRAGDYFETKKMILLK